MTTAQKYQEEYRMTRNQLRVLLFGQQQGLCDICELELPLDFIESQEVNIDHRRSRAHGGLNIVQNLGLTHRECNAHKGARCAPDLACKICFREAEERRSMEKIECDRCHNQWERPPDVRNDPERTKLPLEIPARKDPRLPAINRLYDLCQGCARAVDKYIRNGVVQPAVRRVAEPEPESAGG